MGFHESVRTVLSKKYATFSGRASRSEYWWLQLLYWALLAAYVPLLVTVSEATGGADGLSQIADVLMTILILFVLATLSPQTALHARRFQDCGISSSRYGTLVLLCVIPGFAILAGPAVIVICLLPGTEGPNKYGPDSLIAEPKAEVFT
ncbi:DUF805 domain-containing protein [Rhizobium sp. CF142]|uniref:DUF805 domain-containing protein n=1 Tax=Rhizobium sp. CF142 TaxID=1144314 RepID=UPI00026EF353|nr:DUF805 domain-containing protein [Rhizobium sp. CF142]EJJ26592.1 putative membrane protein [Rhizobium sp. CF142]